ncbi:MAG TPA: GDYXXLXY domain-containing protein [Armatimonadota bacterium]|nr:GDYXXLXY domain-containing protein [Armatimonadota bacterium]
MKMSFGVKFAGLVVLQLLVLCGLMAYKGMPLLSGRKVVLKTVPVDPRDWFRGDYVILRYEISTVELGQWNQRAPEVGDTAYVRLAKFGEFWVASGVHTSAPAGDDVYIRGRVTGVGAGSVMMEYGIESYFIPEGTGHEYERQRHLAVEVMIDDKGLATIKDVQPGSDR